MTKSRMRSWCARWDTALLLIVLIGVPVALSALAPMLLAPRSVVQSLIWVVLVVGLYTFTGLSGVVSFGQTAFSMFGAYCAAWLTLNPFIKASNMPGLPDALQNATLPPLLSAAISVAVAGAAGAVLALAIARVAGEAATIATFSFLIVAYSVFSNWSSVTGGASSIVGIPLVVGPGIAFGGAALAIAVAHAFQTSRVGLMLQASREDEAAALASGVEVRRARILAFALSCALMGLGGVLQAHFLGVISVDTFYLNATFMTLAMLVVGGRSSLTGAVVGALLFSAITVALRGLERGAPLGPFTLQVPSGTAEVLLGALMLLMLILRRRGLCGLWEARHPWPAVGEAQVTAR
jgi:branched-chain amino acid transport system permease protein